MEIRIIITVEDHDEVEAIKNVIADGEESGAIDFGFKFRTVESGSLAELLEREGL